MVTTSPSIQIRDEVGRGALGTVSRGVLMEPWQDWPAGTEVAVKRLLPEHANDPEARAALLAEGRAGMAVCHPGIARAMATGEDGEGAFLVMQYVPGETLGETLAASGPLPESVLRTAIAHVAGGLAALHDAGYSHGDIKPDNVRIDERGCGVLLDLGFARPLTQAGGEWSAVNPGSLAYLAPERARGEPGDPRSDIFSLGVTVYELATGRHPFATDAPSAETGVSSGGTLRHSLEAPGADALLARLATARFIPPSRHVPQLSPFLDHLLEDLLQRDPSRRPSAREVAERMGQLESGDWWRGLTDIAGDPLRGPASGAHLTPLVGRADAMRRLMQRYTETVGVRPHTASAESEQDSGTRGGFLWLQGAAGIGKSRLMNDFAAHVRTSVDPPLYLYARCSRAEIERPCAPLLRLLLRWLRIPEGTLPEPRHIEQLERLIPPKEADTLAKVLDPDFHGATDTSVGEALARWLLRLARRVPVLVVLDDFHAAGDGTLNAIGRVAQKIEDARLLVVLARRTGETFTSPAGQRNVSVRLAHGQLAPALTLEPLAATDVTDLATRLFHHTAPRLRIGTVLWERSRGNPGLIAEILRGLQDKDQMIVRPGSERAAARWMLTVSPDDLPLPESLPNMIQERYAALPADDRLWLRRISVVGGRISADFLSCAFAPDAPGEIKNVLQRLVDAGWIVPAGERYRFARPALREAVYRSLDPDQRREYHRRAGKALAAPAGKPLAIEDALQRAFHLRAAGEHRALLGVLMPLVSALARRGQPQRIHSLARWGLEALDQLPPGRRVNRLRIELLEAAADASDRLGIRTEQRRWLDRLSDLELSAEEDTEDLARVYLLHGRYAVSTGQYGLARGFLRNAVELATNVDGAGELQSEALRRLGAVQAHIGELREARKLVRRAIATAAHHPQEAVAYLQLATIELLEDRLESALRAVDRALRHLRRSPEWHLPGAYAAARMLRGRIYRVAGRPRRARGALQRALRLARQAGERRLELEVSARLGGLLLDLNRPHEAEARLRDALLIAQEIEDRRGQTLAGLWLGILLWENDDPTAAFQLEHAARLAREMGLRRAEALALAIQARIARARGELARSVELAERAAANTEQYGAELADRLVIDGTLALVLESHGRKKQAQELVRKIERRLKRVNERFESPFLRSRHGEASRRLLEAVLSSEGLVYPRVELPPGTTLGASV